MPPQTMATVRLDTTSDHPLMLAVREAVGESNFERWFRHRTVMQLGTDRLIVGVGNAFLLSWMQKQFRPALEEAVRREVGDDAVVEFTVETIRRPKPSAPAVIAKRTKPASPRSSPAPPREKPGRRFADLSDFVVGPSNELAYTAALRICDAPGRYVNPYFLYGRPGLGKTHLLEAIYRGIRRRWPQLQVLMLTAEEFTNCFTESFRRHALPAFRARFRDVDVLLVDDVDFLDGKKVIQEEFFNTLDQLMRCGRQVVVSADRHPKLILEMSEELTSRFLSGLVCRIDSPEEATRRQIVHRKAKAWGLDAAPEALDYLARRFRNNVRELEGALNCLQTYQAMIGRRLSLSAARRAVAHLECDSARVVRLSDIEQVVCDLFGVSADDLKSPRRHRSLSRPRALAMFLARKHTEAAYAEIGQYFGGRNHATVMSAERNVRRWIEHEATIPMASKTWPISDVVALLEEKLLAG